jgi:hypothetical protein
MRPLRAVFGKSPPSAPVIIIDVQDTQRLDTVGLLLSHALLTCFACSSAMLYFVR